MENRLQNISLGEIDITTGQRPLGNLTGLVASIQRIGLTYPVLVARSGSRYRLLDGRRRYYACLRLGWSAIPGIILSVDEQLAEVIAIDANLMREERTPLEQSELRRRRTEICSALPLKATHGNGSGRGHRKEKQEAGNAPTAHIPPNTESTPRSIRQPMPIDKVNHRKGGDSQGSSPIRVPVGSKGSQALISRLIARLFSSQGIRQRPPVPVVAPRRSTQRKVKPNDKRDPGQRDLGTMPKNAQSGPLASPHHDGEVNQRKGREIA